MAPEPPSNRTTRAGVHSAAPASASTGMGWNTPRVRRRPHATRADTTAASPTESGETGAAGAADADGTDGDRVTAAAARAEERLLAAAVASFSFKSALCRRDT